MARLHESEIVACDHRNVHERLAYPVQAKLNIEMEVQGMARYVHSMAAKHEPISDIEFAVTAADTLADMQVPESEADAEYDASALLSW